MAVLAHAINDADSGSINTASFTPTVGRVVFALIGDWVLSGTVGTTLSVTHPGVNSGGAWTKFATEGRGFSDQVRTSLHWGVVTAATASIANIASSSAQPGGMGYTIFDTDTTAINTTTPIVQAKAFSSDATVTGAFGGAMDAALASASNPTISGWFGGFNASTYTGTPRSGWTELGDSYTSDFGGWETQLKSTGEQTGQITWSLSVDGTCGLVAELNLAASGITGTVTATLAPVTLSSAGVLAIKGTVNATLAAVTLSSSGSVAGLHGAVAATLAPVTLSSAGKLAISGSLSATLGPLTLQGGTARFPVAASVNGRYLVTPGALPLPILGRASWYIVALGTSARTAYLDDVVAKGFTAIEMKAIGHYANTSAPAAGNGALPFTTKLGGGTYTGIGDTPDFATMNSTYWSFVDALLAECESRGLIVLFFPAYVGFPGASPRQGWMDEMVANGQTKVFNYGAAIATRYQHQKNLIWMVGGDNGTFSGSEATVEQALIDGLQSITTDATIYSAEWSSGQVNSGATFGSRINTSPAYSFEGLTDTFGRSAYSLSPAKPAFLLEEPYDEEGPDGNNVNSNATQPVRRFIWWGILSAIGGYMAGNGFVWPFNTGYTSHLNTAGAQDLARLNAMWSSLRWWELVPHGLGSIGTLVTAGGGTVGTGNYVAAAANPSGSLLLAYVPPSHTGSVTIDLTKMGGPLLARWWDPTDGTFTAIGDYLNSGTQAFTVPGANHAGDADWLLVLTFSGGALAATLDPLTLTSVGKLAIAGTVTATLAPVTLSSAAQLAIKGSVAATLAAVTLAATGGSGHVGAATATLADLALASSAKLAITGAAAATLGDMTCAAAAKLAIVGSAAPTLDPVTSAGVGRLAIVGQGAATLAPLTLVATSTSGATGHLVGTLASVTLVAAGLLTGPAIVLPVADVSLPGGTLTSAGDEDDDFTTRTS